MEEYAVKFPCIVGLWLIGPDITSVGWSRTVCEAEAKGGNAERLVSTICAFMRCVDNALMGQPQGGDGEGEVQIMLTYCLDKHYPTRKARY